MMLPPLSLSLQFEVFDRLAQHRALLSRARVRRWVGFALERSATVGVRVVGRPSAQALNLRYRGKDYATNVLTFAYAQAPQVHADLVLCGPVVEQEAAQLGRSLQAHYAHLLVHGTLHAQGWDHETNERDALAMETLEGLLLGALGYANPYS